MNNLYLVRDNRDNGDSSFSSYQSDRIEALKNERANLLKEIARKDATIRTLRFLNAELANDVEQLKQQIKLTEQLEASVKNGGV